MSDNHSRRSEQMEIPEQPVASKASSVEQRIDEILKRVDHHKDGDNPEGNPFMPLNLSIEEAKQQLLSLIAEVIGEDEPIQPLSVKLSKSVRYATFQRNELRAEQRSRLKGVNHE